MVEDISQYFMGIDEYFKSLRKVLGVDFFYFSFEIIFNKTLFLTISLY